MATVAPGIVPQAFDAFVRKQAVADVIVNIVLTGGINYLLTRKLDAVPLVLPFGNSAPNLAGTAIAIAVLMSILLTLIVFAITVSQRKAGRIVPGLPATVRSGAILAKLVGKHLAITLIPAIVLTVLAGKFAPETRMSPVVFVLLATAIAGTAAWFMSQSTTRATLKLG